MYYMPTKTSQETPCKKVLPKLIPRSAKNHGFAEIFKNIVKVNPFLHACCVVSRKKMETV